MCAAVFASVDHSSQKVMQMKVIAAWCALGSNARSHEEKL
jgi:hypothetical protein